MRLLLKARDRHHVGKYATAQLKKERERRVALAKSQVEHHRSQERARQERASAEGKEFVPNDSTSTSRPCEPGWVHAEAARLRRQRAPRDRRQRQPVISHHHDARRQPPGHNGESRRGQTPTRAPTSPPWLHIAPSNAFCTLSTAGCLANLTTTATVEWQARGLPHLHLIVTNERQDRVLQAADADHFTTCEAPDNNDELLNLVAKFMQHKHKAGECCEAEDLNETTGELHDKNARCKQGFPRPLAAYTHEVDEGGELLLRCRGRRVDAPVSANNATERNPSRHGRAEPPQGGEGAGSAHAGGSTA